MSADKLIVGLPSKGRLMEQAAEVFTSKGLKIETAGAARGYQGSLSGWRDVEIAYVASAEIAGRLRSGGLHLGITGEDLVRESSAGDETAARSLAKLGFGPADVVVAVPDCWLDVNRVADLEVMAMTFRRRTGRRVRVATKYLNLTRRSFAKAGIVSYRIVESLGATEGAPAAGLAELIVDITTTGATLKANGLKVLEDGVLLKSEANLWISDAALWSAAQAQTAAALLKVLGLGGCVARP
jgi:ATP phosphoribosyltransferase